MSHRAMQWLTYEAPLELDAIEFKLLTIIADNVDHNGRGFGKSVKTLVELYRAPISERTVRAKLEHMRQLGVLRYGDQRLVSYLPGNRRPKVYDIAMITEDDLERGMELDRGAEYAPQEDGADDDWEHEPAGETEPSRDGDVVDVDPEQGCSWGAAGVQLGCSWPETGVKPCTSDKSIKNIKSIKPIKNPEREHARAGQPKTGERRSRLMSLTPDDQHRALAAAQGLDPDAELDAYRDWCLANDRYPADPAAGYRKWLRHARQFPATAVGRAAPALAVTGSTASYEDRARRLLDTSMIVRSRYGEQMARDELVPVVAAWLRDGVTPADIVHRLVEAA